MRTVLSTADMTEGDSFRLWREMISDRMGPLEMSRLGDRPFEGLIETADIGSLLITRVRESAMRTKVTPETLRRRERTESAFVLIQLAGCSANVQDDREAVQRSGEVVVLADRPNVHVSSQGDRSLVIELPVEALERALGPTKQYTALTLGAGDGTGALVTNFFSELVRVHAALDPDTAVRMSEIGIDLIVASIATCLGRDAPRFQTGNVVVQRAKAYIEANLGDAALDPAQVAAALGISLRRLQELFHATDRQISDWIWERRLATAAERLIDPRLRHTPIGILAYDCGFTSQAHFARRFKERYGQTPSAYRRHGHDRDPAA